MRLKLKENFKGKRYSINHEELFSERSVEDLKKLPLNK